MAGQSLKSYTNVILKLLETKAEKLAVNTSWNTSWIWVIKLLDKLIATETEVSAVLYLIVLYSSKEIYFNLTKRS